jgi:hypothetical protein
MNHPGWRDPPAAALRNVARAPRCCLAATPALLFGNIFAPLPLSTR